MTFFDWPSLVINRFVLLEFLSLYASDCVINLAPSFAGSVHEEPGPPYFAKGDFGLLKG